MTRTKLFCFLLLTLASAASIFPQAAAAEPGLPPHSLRAEVSILGRAVAPYPRDFWVVFSYRPVSSARFVAVRFEHEGYSVLHPLALNEKSTFVLVYRPPATLDRLTYRMGVDGLWMRDPANPVYTTDSFGTEYSQVDLSGLFPAPEHDPIVHADGEVTFTLRGEPGRIVSVAGSFNRWDPFVHALEETSPGVYSLTLRLPRGAAYYYYFLSNGGKLLDPANDETRRSPEGELVCYFQVP